MNKNGIFFIPYGGTNEIGMNLNAFFIKRDKQEEWIIVDYGVAMQRELGIQIVMAEFKDLLSKNIIGIVITHGHEDHIGALHHFVKKFDRQIPIFTTSFTAQMIQRKFDENKVQDYKINVVKNNQKFSVGSFSIEMIYITHSIPEPHMVLIEGEGCRILHTGDWKFDEEPVLGDVTNKEKIRKAAGNIDVLIGDSTNAPKKQRTGSEGMVKRALNDIVKELHGKRVIISCFASNVARVKSIIEVAKGCGRKVLLLGRSLETIFGIAKQQRLILEKDIPHVVSINDAADIPNHKLLVVCTGSQGEKGAVLYKLSNEGDFYPIKLQHNDVVIFSSRIIPGNEIPIMEIKNNFIKRKVEIIDSDIEENIHVSGHPSSIEINEMIELTNPKSVIPVHGDPYHLHALAKVAHNAGVKHTLIPYNGAVIKLSSQPQIIANVPVGILGLDGRNLVRMDSKFLQERSQLGKNGIVIIIIDIHTRKLKKTYSFGFLPQKILTGENYLNFLKQHIIENRNKKAIEIINTISFQIERKYKKQPVILVDIV